MVQLYQTPKFCTLWQSAVSAVAIGAVKPRSPEKLNLTCIADSQPAVGKVKRPLLRCTEGRWGLGGLITLLTCTGTVPTLVPEMVIRADGSRAVMDGVTVQWISDLNAGWGGASSL